MKIREPSSADMTRMALTEKREREPGIVVVSGGFIGFGVVRWT